MIGIDSMGLRIVDYPFDPKIEKFFDRTIAHMGKAYEEVTWTYDYNNLDGIVIKFVFRPRDKGGRQSMYIYISSVAKLAYGNNFTAFPDVEVAIDAVNEALSKIPGIPEIIGIRKARLYRLDLFCHYKVGCEDIENYLQILYRSSYPGRIRGPYLNDTNPDYNPEFNNGISFFTSSKKIKSNFYDKFQQCRDKRTLGILRHEIQISSARNIAQATGLEEFTFEDINQEIFNRLILRDQFILRMNEPIIDEHRAENLLKLKYGNKTGASLYCLMLYLQKHPTLEKKDLAAKLGIKLDTLTIKLNEITKAGISPIILDGHIELPPLVSKLN